MLLSSVAVGNKWIKTCIIIGSCAFLSISVFSLYIYFKNKKRMIDEGFEDIMVPDDGVKKILVLGIEGAGKSNLLYQLSKSCELESKPQTTEGFSVLNLPSNSGITLNFWEIAGSKQIRVYWPNFIHDTDVLIYVVDSSDDHKLPESIIEFQNLLASNKLRKVPILILANKQDLPNAASRDSIAEAFGVGELSKTHKIRVLPLQVPLNINEPDETVYQLKDMVEKECSN